MSLFAKNKPTKKVTFEGAWVELQYLSKGVKDELQNQLLTAVKGIDPQVLDKLEKDSQKTEGAIISTKEVNTSELPIELISSLNSMADYALSKAIVAWSEKEEISLETVKELDGDTFDKLVEEVNKMNNLDLATVKN